MKRRRLGQHYLVDREAVETVVGLAGVKPSERILEIGTGKGALSAELAKRGASYLGYEVDRDNFAMTKEAVRGTGAMVILADAFGRDPDFDVLVASLPYSESAAFVRWLCGRRFARAVVILQKDFVEKITAPPGTRAYRGISALAQIAFRVEPLADVHRDSFEPPPKVNSVIASFKPRQVVSAGEAANVIRLFSLRRRQVDSALAELGFQPGQNHGRRRVSSLTPDEVHAICG